jgi:hypothetical protein
MAAHQPANELPGAGTGHPATRIDLALFNYENGGRLPDGGYDFLPLRRAFAQAEVQPALILFCFTDRRARLKPLTWGFAQLTCSRRHRGRWRSGVNGSGELRVVAACCGAVAR